MIEAFLSGFVLGMLLGYIISALVTKHRESKFMGTKHRCSCGKMLNIKFDGKPVVCGGCGTTRIFKREHRK